MRAWQSSTLDASIYVDYGVGDWSPSADKVVDGNTDGQFWNRSCSHTQDVPRPWLAIDLQSTKYIAGMRITNRQDMVTRIGGEPCCQGGCCQMHLCGL